MSTARNPQVPSRSDSEDQSVDPLMEPLSEITFDYEKSRFCRVLHADGAWGGITAQGNVYMALFSEHAALPRTVNYRIEVAGGLQETGRDVTDHLVREVEAEVILGPAAALSLRNWLNERLELLEKLRSASSQQREAGSK